MTAAVRPTDNRRLFAYVAIGVALGLLFVVFDVLSEARIGRGTLTGAMADVHAVVDHVSPVVGGALLGVCAHYLRMRARLFAAEESASRADALRARLAKVERDQAVWVLAAAVLHELNNPLHAIGLLLDELTQSEGDAARHSDLADRARAQADRALAHLATLRSMHTTGEPDLQPIALDELVRAIAADVTPLASEAGLTVRFEATKGVMANADPTYVRTILENLIDNGIASMRERGHGCITLRVDSVEGRAIVRVEDDGAPVDAAVRATLFEPLRTTKTHGLGLGLPIARALARAMRGDLSLEDRRPSHHDAKSFRLELPSRDPS